MLDIQTCRNTLNRFGSVRSSSLRVRGRTAIVHLQWNPGHRTYINDGYAALTDVGNFVAGVVYPDIMNEMQFVDELVCLEVQYESHLSIKHVPALVSGKHFPTEEELEEMNLVMGLALLPVPGRKGFYQRRGLARWLKGDLFDDKIETDSTIV